MCLNYVVYICHGCGAEIHAKDGCHHVGPLVYCTECYIKKMFGIQRHTVVRLMDDKVSPT